MFNQLISTLNSSIESFPIRASNHNQPSKESHQIESNIDIDKIVQTVLKQLTIKLSEKLGESVDQSELRDIGESLLLSKGLESQLIETKQRYNDLVNKSTSLYQQARKISSSIGEFISSINLFLQSQQLLIPLKEIQKGINDLQAEKVEKQINYLIRIFQTNFEEIINKKVKNAESSLQQQLKSTKASLCNLQLELNNFKNSKNQDESKYYEFNLKVTALNEKISKLSVQKSELQKKLKNQAENTVNKERTISQYQKQINRLKLKQAQLLDKIKLFEVKFSRNERNLKEQNNDVQALNSVIQKLKAKQEEIVQQMQKQFKKRQALSQILRKKLHNQKIYLEERLQILAQKNTSLQADLLAKQEQVKLLLKQKEKQDNIEIELDHFTQDKEQSSNCQKIEEVEGETKLKQKVTLDQIISKMKHLQNRTKELQGKLSEGQKVNVNKQVLKNLFISYDDQSKEWATRRNIKYQIYSLLGMSQKIPKVEQPKTSKWFGIF